MQKSIQLNKKNIIYTLKVNRRARNIRLIIHQDGSCIVTTPKYIPQFIIDRFLIEKSDWIINKIEYFFMFKNIPLKNKKEKKEDYLKHKDRALKIIKERIEFFNKYYNHKWNRITIKNQKTRWGSCSKKGNLNFNYKIALLSEKISDYIIVHELCHLREFNHSRNFWNLVAKTIPDYIDIKKELKKRGLELS